MGGLAVAFHRSGLCWALTWFGEQCENWSCFQAVGTQNGVTSRLNSSMLERIFELFVSNELPSMLV